jgi:hypothetical protein
MEKKTINEWEKVFDVVIYDPDGFDRSNPNLYNELFTRDEFLKGMYLSTIMMKADKLGGSQ